MHNSYFFVSLQRKKQTKMKLSKILIVVVAILFVGCRQEAPLTFVAGNYEATVQGHNGDVKVRVTFNDSCLERIEVLEQTEPRRSATS